MLGRLHIPQAVCLHIPQAVCLHIPQAVCLHFPQAVCLHIPQAVCLHIPQAVCLHIPQAVCLHFPRAVLHALLISRVGQNRMYTPYMTVNLVISLTKVPYVDRIYMVLANPTYFGTYESMKTKAQEQKNER